MDMKISGSGTVPAGEYEVIKISGSGSLEGNVKCTELHVSGSAGADASVECSGEIHVSGACDFGGDVKAKTLHISGAINCDKNLTALESVHLSGGVNVGENLKCSTLDAHGGLNIDGDIEAETASIHGALCCGGLLNAESIEIDTKDGCMIGSIGGSKIVIKYKKRKFFKNLISITFNDKQVRGVQVEQSIEGDDIDVNNVTCPRVSGRVVVIGEDCDIALLQYSESYEIHEKAKVGRIEKI